MKKPFHKLIVPADVADFVRKMHPQLKKKIKASLKIILSDPESGKVLRDELAGLRSFRVSRFRIIYRISQNKFIEIVAIGPRKRIYEETFRILNR
jgi:mRNA interferase RelE/StbE